MLFSFSISIVICLLDNSIPAMNFFLFSLIASLAPFILADVEFVTPTAGAALTGDTVVSIAWQDSGTAPSISDLTNYVINLCAGGNTAGSFECSLAVLVAGGAFSSGNTASGTIAESIGADATNG